MADDDSTDNNGFLIEITAEVVSAYVSNNFVPAMELGSLIAEIHKALVKAEGSTHLQETAVAGRQIPAVSIKKSVKDDEIACLECGQKFKSLKRHLTSNHRLSATDYREKWSLNADYPMVAPNYAEARSRLAKSMGLGQKRKRGSKAA